MNVERIKTTKRKEAVDITAILARYAKGIENGLMVVYVPHTTAGVTVNESYDPDVASDILDKLVQIAPYGAGYKHLEGNADAHIQATLVGSSVTLIIENGRLALGRWQGVFFMEFDGPRVREIYIKTIGD